MKGFLHSRIKSFYYAGKGIWLLFTTQTNAKIHLAAALGVVAAGYVCEIGFLEWAILTLTIGFVFAAEAFNTAIEWMVDKIAPTFDVEAGKIKDMAAGAVLLASLAAALVGILVFLPRIYLLIFS